MKKKILMIVIPIAGIVILISFIINSYNQRVDYSLDVDALKDEQPLSTDTRVILTNTGKLKLTNITIDYGNSIDKLSYLEPGQKYISSPSKGTSLNYVEIKTNEGIVMQKEFRKPIKMPGMIGS